MKKDEALLPRTNLPAYVTDQTMDDLNRLCLVFTEGNRAEFVRQCLEIGIREFEMLLRSKKIMNNARLSYEILCLY